MRPYTVIRPVKYNIPMRSRIILGAWLVGMLFPAIWLRQFSTIYRQAFDRLFGPQWVHIFMHLVLYAVLAVLLTRVLRLKSNRKDLLKLALLLLTAGILQEIFQAASQGVALFQLAILSAAALDLAIDLTGGLAGFTCLSLVRILRGRAIYNRSAPTRPLLV